MRSIVIDPVGKVLSTLQTGAFETEKGVAAIHAVARLHSGWFSSPTPYVHIVKDGMSEAADKKDITPVDEVRFVFNTRIAKMLSTKVTQVTNMTKDGPEQVQLFTYRLKLTFKAFGKDRVIVGMYTSQEPLEEGYNIWLIASQDTGDNWKFSNPSQKAKYRFNLLHSMVMQLVRGTQITVMVYPVLHKGAAMISNHLQNKALWIQDLLKQKPATALSIMQNERSEYATGDQFARKTPDVPVLEGVRQYEDFLVDYQVGGRMGKKVQTANWLEVPTKTKSNASRLAVIYQKVGTTYQATGQKMRITGRNKYSVLHEIATNGQAVLLKD